jgi:DNA-binding transcriptional MerR regulator
LTWCAHQVKRGKSTRGPRVVVSVRIGEAASASGVSVRSLRYYEDEGLIVPGRLANGYRDYCGGTIDRVIAVRALLDSGLPVRLIRDVVDGVPSARFLAEVRDYRDRLAARIAAMNAQKSALDEFLLTFTPASGSYVAGHDARTGPAVLRRP